MVAIERSAHSSGSRTSVVGREKCGATAEAAKRWNSRTRRLQEPGQTLSDGSVQAPVLLPQGEPVAAGDLIDSHGDFHQHAIQRQKDVEHFVGLPLAEELIV
ncbi:MAG: hypothetical protein WA830_22360 [Candidatus Sulfotelmatobacter sp.]